MNEWMIKELRLLVRKGGGDGRKYRKIENWANASSFCLLLICMSLYAGAAILAGADGYLRGRLCCPGGGRPRGEHDCSRLSWTRGAKPAWWQDLFRNNQYGDFCRDVFTHTFVWIWGFSWWEEVPSRAGKLLQTGTARYVPCSFICFSPHA